MVRFIALIMLSLFVSRTQAQQQHFIYIQTENKKTFYVKMGEKVLSASASGYLIIPKLSAGNHELLIGFPKDEFPQQMITVPVADMDAGYLLKNFETKGWGLYNMQTMEVLLSGTTKPIKETKTTPVEDGFANTLADVVSTPSIKQQPIKENIEPNRKDEVVQKEEPKPIVSTEKIENVSEKAIQPVETIKAESLLVPSETTTVQSELVKLNSGLDSVGNFITYIDRGAGLTDTIKIWLPIIKLSAALIPASDEKVVAEKKESEPLVEKSVPVKQEPVFIEDEIKEVKKLDTAVVATQNEKRKEDAANQLVMINSDCKQVASDNDFLKLRRKMAAQNTEEHMIVVARKSLSGKCYSTAQVNNLSVLFLHDAGRYGFFEMMYPYVTDTQQYTTLLSQLTEDEYVQKFNNLIRH